MRQSEDVLGPIVFVWVLRPNGARQLSGNFEWRREKCTAVQETLKGRTCALERVTDLTRLLREEKLRVTNFIHIRIYIFICVCVCVLFFFSLSVCLSRFSSLAFFIVVIFFFLIIIIIITIILSVKRRRRLAFDYSTWLFHLVLLRLLLGTARSIRALLRDYSAEN